MKRSYLFILALAIATVSGVSDSFAAKTSESVSTAAPIVGSANGQTAWVLTFNYEAGVPGANEVRLNGQTGVFGGSFWSETVGWCTFDGLGADTAKLTGTADVMPMVGYASCENAGWIKFNATGVATTDAYFKKSEGKFHGYGWSESLGWISMEGLSTDITPPDVSNFDPFAADNNKSFTIKGDPVPVPSGGSYDITLDKWDSGNAMFASPAQTFSYDFRKAKPYSITIKDPFGNSAAGTITVVAATPSTTLHANNIGGGATATQMGSTFGGVKVADASEKHSLWLNLRDTYGNPVINETGIKTVSVDIVFNNKVRLDQTPIPIGIDGDAIVYNGSFGGLVASAGINSDATSNGSDGKYALDIASYAPTKEWYGFAGIGNNIALTSLAYTISPVGTNTGVGETPTKVDVASTVGASNLKFAPAIRVTNVTNSDTWAIRAGYESTFSAGLESSGAVAPTFTAPRIRHALDIGDNSSLLNTLISYQDPKPTNALCFGYNRTVQTFSPPVLTTGGYIPTDIDCSTLSNASAIVMVPANYSSPQEFKWTPTIIYAAPANNRVSYASQISYKNGTKTVKYPSWAWSTDSATLADGSATVMTTASGIINQAVKVFGASNNAIDVLSGNNTQDLGSLTRTDIKNLIHKNVATLTQGGVPADANYKVFSADTTINDSSFDKTTIIVRGANVVINGDITSGAQMKGIIAIKDDAGNGGNIYITKDVKNISAVLYADENVVSGPSAGTFYSDTKSATNQLFLLGSIISNNTIGGASMIPYVCPYNVTTCDNTTSKHYDLNYFRFYTGGAGTSAVGVPTGGESYPFVIQYDTRLQTTPPPGFAQWE